MDFKNMSIPEILGFQDKLEKELNSRTNNLVGTLSAIEEIESKSQRTHKYYANKIKNLKNKNEELKELEKLGFSVFMYSGGNIGIINYEIKDRPDSYYGLEVDIENKEIVFKENFYMEVSQMSKIKEILKLI
ncbi:MAG: hypothetical protein RBT22_00580 [Aliarcobacter sp.]|jgi:hypothetical protein|nr:hypothetical protein [Aliarcobacter sp.]